MKILITILLLTFTNLVFAERDERYPGLPDYGNYYNGNQSKEACNARVQGIMYQLTGNRFILHCPEKIIFEERPAGVREHVVGGTKPVYVQDRWDHFERRSSEVYVYDGSSHTLHHELSHVYRNGYASQRGHLEIFNDFLDEGSAEMVAWSIDPEAVHDRLEWLRYFVKSSNGWQGFRDQIGMAMERRPDCPEYSLAGFFACQWMSCFPPNKYEDAFEILIIDQGNAKQTEWKMEALLARQHITLEQFWKGVWFNANKWTNPNYNPIVID